MKSTTLVHYLGPFTCPHTSSYLSPTKKQAQHQNHDHYLMSSAKTYKEEFCCVYSCIVPKLLVRQTHFIVVSGSHNSTAATNFNNVVVFRLQHHVSINHIYSISLSISSGYNSIVCVHCIIIKLETVLLKYFLLGLFIKSSVSLLIIPNSK